MKEYVDLALKKEKKSASLEKIFSRIEKFLISEGKEGILSNDQKNEIKNILDNGVKRYDYILTSNGYKLISKTSFRKGKFIGDKRGNGIVRVNSSYMDKDGNLIPFKEEYRIDAHNSNGAIDGDLVLIDNGGKSNNAVVEKVIKRNLENVVGEIYREGSSYYVRPVDKKQQSLIIQLSGEHIEGQRVAVELKEHPSDNFYTAEVVRTFDHKDDPDEEVLWEAFKYGRDDYFSKESWEQVSYIPQTVRESDKIGREDLTDWEIFTIDGADTIDIDDALSCKKLSNGNYEIGVHIADVSNYVTEKSPLDIDAYRKGTSSYLVGKVIPMLPHELSNGICSLNPHVERLALSCIMEVNNKGEVVNYRIRPTVIKSNIKMTYDNVNKILKEGIVPDEYKKHEDTLRNLNKIALILRKNRIKKGAIEFNKPEMKLKFDDNGEVIGFDMRVQDVGENLIEEFMLLANETVDKFIVDHGFPALHRVHDTPNVDRLTDFLLFLDAIGYPYDNADAEEIAMSRERMQELVEHASKTGQLSSLLTTELVKCQSRAKYSPNNIGHYGLAKDNYLHFTSPIRRYPDLTIHRIVKDILDGKKVNINKWKLLLGEIGEHTSKTERNADDAEKATLRLKCCEYMGKHIGEEFECTITGVNDHGINVELDNMVEGQIRLKDLPGQYIYSGQSYSLVSLDNKQNYYVGDRLRVRVKDASKENKKIYFEVVSKLNENKTVNADEINKMAKVKAKIDKSRKAFR